MTIKEKDLKNFPNALSKTYKKGTEDEFKVYFINVLEAKLICSNGFCISLATEWIENPKDDYEKQDCELKAFGRLAKKLKKNFPRLPICITADGLYSNNTGFNICKKHGWEFIFTFQDGNLKSVWDEVERLAPTEVDNYKCISSFEKVKNKENKIITKQSLTCLIWTINIVYKNHLLNIIQGFKTTGECLINKFTYISSLNITTNTAEEIYNSGRARFGIENNGFNTQKNLGYNISHKYSRTSELAMKNYYSCIQIAHMINQFIEQKIFLEGRETMKYIWNMIRSFFALIVLPVGSTSAIDSQKKVFSAQYG
jgi:hypothetical protein